jgi:ferredoxin-type protein NapH
MALLWVALLLLVEIFYTRRAWCRYICPIGLTYGFVDIASPLRVVYHLDRCTHDGLCKPVCLVPHVLDVVLRNRAVREHQPIAADCTRCGRCVDVCPHQALTFNFRGVRTRP